jgi:hypothetical protein
MTDRQFLVTLVIGGGALFLVGVKIIELLRRK